VSGVPAVLAHGAGAGMSHPFMEGGRWTCRERHRHDALSFRIWSRVQSGRMRPNLLRPLSGRRSLRLLNWCPACPCCWRQVFWWSHDLASPSRLALARRPHACFPRLSPSSAGRGSDERATHLFEVKIPMLFLQGTRDALADTHTLQALVERLGTRTTLKLFRDADHSFHVSARTERTDAEVQDRNVGYVSVLAAKCGLEDYRARSDLRESRPDDGRRGGHSCFGRRDEMSKEFKARS
jgi:uncharacterized protein